MHWIHTKYSTPTPAFQLALADHIKDLSPAEQQAFVGGNSLSIEVLMDHIRQFDENHSQTSRSRSCAERIEKFLGILGGYVKGLVPFTSQTPIASLVIGGINFIIDVCLNPSYFTCNAHFFDDCHSWD